MGKRSSNHSIDRFLLVTVLGWFYEDYYLFCGDEKEFRSQAPALRQAEQAGQLGRGVIQTRVLAQAMNVCLQDRDAVLLRQGLAGEPEGIPDGMPEEGEGAESFRAVEPEEVLYRKLKQLMQLQYADEKERQALREQAARVKEEPSGNKVEVGIQRKTVKNLVEELLTLERRLQALPDQDLADWLAGRVQGFRLRQVPSGAPLYHIAPVGQPAQQMAAVQAAYYPFLDKRHTGWMLDLLGLTSERRQNLLDISDGEEKPDSPSGRWESGLAEQLELALTAVETVWKIYGEQETDELFWYELTYHRWQCREGKLVLCPREEPIPLLPWQVVYSNGYFYLCGLRLDLPAAVTGGDRKEPVFSNLRLDRIRNLHRVDCSESDVDYTVKDLQKLVQQLYQSGYRAPMTYRDVTTLMYSGTPEPLLIDCDPTLMNSAVDDFGRKNIEQAVTLPDGRVRIRVKGAVWGGARQWLLQHAGQCCLAPVPEQAEHRRELAAALRQAAETYEG